MAGGRGQGERRVAGGAMLINGSITHGERRAQSSAKCKCCEQLKISTQKDVVDYKSCKGRQQQPPQPHDADDLSTLHWCCIYCAC